MKVLVRIRYSHALRLVPSRNWWKDAYALAYVSCTRSSASAGLRVMRSAAEYIWSRNSSASRSKRALRSAVDSALTPWPSGSSAWPLSVPASVPVTGPTSSRFLVGPKPDPLESEDRTRPVPAAARMEAVLATCSTVQSRSALLLRLGQMVEPMRRTSFPTTSVLLVQHFCPPQQWSWAQHSRPSAE